MQRKRRDDRQHWLYRVYAYGATLRDRSTPPTWPDALRQVVFSQRDLWNAYHAAWEKNREAYEALMAQADALTPLREAREQARQALGEVEAQIKRQRAMARARRYVGWQDDDSARVAARAALRTAISTLKVAEAAYRLAIKPQLTQLLDTLWKEVHELGQASSLAWYNERQITDSFRNCVERFLKHLGGPPKPKRHLSTAHLTYHFTGPPLTWEQLLMGKSSMVTFGDAREVLPVDPWVWDETQPQNPRRRASRTQGHLRITDEDTLDFGVTLQRRPPEGSLIKGVELVGRETLRPFAGTPGRWRWMLYVLCEIPPRDLVQEGEPTPRRSDAEVLVREGKPAPMAITRAAIDLNWRILDDDRIRVGMLYDGMTHTPLYFPAELVRRWRYAQDLQNDISAQLERCKDTLKRLWDETPLPPDVDPRGAGWAQTGKGGLLRLLRAVEALPPTIPSRQPTLDVLTGWARRTGKIWREWRGLTGRLERAKAAWYSVTAKQLCTQFQQLAIEDLDLRQMAQQADQAPRLKRSQKYRQLVGLGAFLTRLTHTAQREGVTLIKINSAGTTLECAVCGEPVAQTGEIFLTCTQGHHRDTDANAAEVIYTRAFAAPAASAPR